MNKPLTTVWAELRRGKTINRSLLNVELSRILSELSGKAVDLGGGSSGSYLRFIPERLTLVRTDYQGEGLDAFVDISNALPFSHDSFDAVLLLNALYVVPDPQAVLREIMRILKPGGKLILSTPYLMAEMREPHDYYRFTSEWLEETLNGIGFENLEIIAIGERFTTIANLIDGFGTRLGNLVLYPLASMADSLLPRRIKREHPAPITYVSVASTPL